MYCFVARLSRSCLPVVCSLAVLALLFVVTLPAESYVLEYLPVPDSDLCRRVRQTMVCDPLMPGETACFERSRVEISKQSDFLVHGCDLKGKPWTVVGRCEHGYLSVWAGDLDDNGQSDLILFSRNPDAGSYDAASRLTLVMFESNGRPVPWQISGHFQVDRHGVKDLLDLDEDGKAELVMQHCDSGYWITSLYEADKSRWQMRAYHNRRQYPLYTRFTYKTNRSISGRQLAGSLPSLDCTNAGVTQVALVDELISRPVGGTSIITGLLSNGGKFVASPFNASVVLVLDEPGRRRIVLGTRQQDLRRLLVEVMHRRLPLTVAGANKKDATYSPQLLWASAAKPTQSPSLAMHARVIRPELTESELP